MIIDNIKLFPLWFGIAPLSDSFSRISFVLTQQKIEYEIVKQNLPGKKGMVCEKKHIFKMLKDET